VDAFLGEWVMLLEVMRVAKMVDVAIQSKGRVGSK
jgi:hypothetical protein